MNNTLKTPLYPDVEVPLTGQDGNAFFIIGRVSKALKDAGHADAVKEFQDEATSGDFSNVLRTCSRYVSIS